jgi:hypothetical protein
MRVESIPHSTRMRVGETALNTVIVDYYGISYVCSITVLLINIITSSTIPLMEHFDHAH